MKSVFRISGEIVNTLHLSLGFFVLFAADFTLTGVQKIMNVSIEEDHADYHVDAYVSLGLTYILYAVFLMLVPSVISIIGPRISMVLGIVFTTSHFFLYSFEKTYLTYVGAVMTAAGGSLIWVGQGNYLIMNAKKVDITVHTAVFWAIFVTSMLVGNTFNVFTFAGRTRVDYDVRRILFSITTGFGIAAAVVTMFLRPPKGNLTQLSRQTPSEAFKKTVAMYFSRDFVTLLTVFCYIGFQQSFGWGVYHSTLGFTRTFGPVATQLVPIDSIVFGLGDLIGAGIHIVAPKLGFHWTRRHVFCSGFVVHILAIIGIFLNVPDLAMFGYTDEEPIIGSPKIWLALLCAFSLGIVDGFYNTQIYPLLANLYPTQSAQSMALFKFTKSFSAGAYFFICTSVGLYFQLLILAVSGFVSIICFSVVDKAVYRRNEEMNVKPIKSPVSDQTKCSS